MAERVATAGGTGGGAFKDFLKSIPTANEAAKNVQLIGMVRRGDKDGTFTLTLQNGQAVELAAEHVTQFTVLRPGPTPIVQIDLPTDKIPSPKVLKEITK